MSTIDFIKKNSSNFVEQELWEEEIINKNYDDIFEMNNNEYNNFSKNTLNEGEEEYEFKLERIKKEIFYYNCTVDKLKLDNKVPLLFGSLASTHTLRLEIEVEIND